MGRVGRGPNEFTNPGRLLGFGGDTTALVDYSNRRLLLISPAGRPGGTINLPVTADHEGTQLRVGGRAVARPSIIPEFSDRTGRIYERRTVNGVDSAHILRADRIGAVPQRLAVLKSSKTFTERFGATSAWFPLPFSGRDEWTVALDGTVIIARVQDYRIEVIGSDGQRTVSTPVTFEPVRVTQAEREQALIQPGFAALPAPSVATFKSRLTREIPEFKPPFSGRIHAAPNEMIWVPTARRSRNDPLVYDVLDRRGRRVALVQMPPRTTIVGFGRDAIYATRADEFDLLYLQRFALPRLQ
ncbi:MAG: hypothetical protein ACREMA_07050 [Longimicrobiales bacterium]